MVVTQAYNTYKAHVWPTYLEIFSFSILIVTLMMSEKFAVKIGVNSAPEILEIFGNMNPLLR